MEFLPFYLTGSRRYTGGTVFSSSRYHVSKRVKSRSKSAQHLAKKASSSSSSKELVFSPIKAVLPVFLSFSSLSGSEVKLLPLLLVMLYWVSLGVSSKSDFLLETLSLSLITIFKIASKSFWEMMVGNDWNSCFWPVNSCGNTAGEGRR